MTFFMLQIVNLAVITTSDYNNIYTVYQTNLTALITFQPIAINRPQSLRQRFSSQRSISVASNRNSQIVRPYNSQASFVPMLQNDILVEEPDPSPQRSSTSTNIDEISSGYTHGRNQTQQTTPTSSNLQPANSNRNTVSQPNEANSPTTPTAANQSIQSPAPTSSSSNSQATKNSSPEVTVNLNDIMHRLIENPKSVPDQEKQLLLSALPEDERSIVNNLLHEHN